MKALIISLLTTIMSSCVMIDSKVSKILPSASSARSFVGVYKNRASYRSSSWIGLYNQDLLQEYLGVETHSNDALDVRITYKNKRLNSIVRFPGGKTEQRSFQLGSDFEFVNGYLEFNGKVTASGGNDSPSFGYVARERRRWTINENGDLVITTRNATLGTVSIIPVAMTSNWMAVFPRKQ